MGNRFSAFAALPGAEPGAVSCGDGSRGLAHVSCGGEPGALCCRDEGPARDPDRYDAVHGCLDMMEGTVAGIVGDRPFLSQPVQGLFGSGDFLDVTVRRHDKGQGLAPVDFDQRQFFRGKGECRRIEMQAVSRGRKGRCKSGPAFMISRIAAQARARSVAESRPLRSRSRSNETA